MFQKQFEPVQLTLRKEILDARHAVMCRPENQSGLANQGPVSLLSGEDWLPFGN
jgi:hypothetical protein